ncbi:hypothetical protein HPB50_006898 [Hyalomma asiaticum]|uniref:Uncharacterized protein n=1 Tax=Hyalomma asiaticum TaxID=266040 RepID=A0ACB7RZ68_HYAAI|nr:hypothetical protein HPB50_006898 [Hyalomma asiaticum]
MYYARLNWTKVLHLVFAEEDSRPVKPRDLVASAEALVRIQYRILSSFQWAYRDAIVTLRIQASANSDTIDMFLSLHHHPSFTVLLQAIEKNMEHFTAYETVHLLDALLKLCVPKNHDVLVKLQERCIVQSESLDLVGLVKLAEASNFLKRNGFVVCGLVCSLVQQSSDVIPFAADSYKNVATILCHVAYFFSTEYVDSALVKLTSMLSSFRDTVSPSDSLLILEAAIRFSSKDAQELKPFLDHCLQNCASLSMNELSKLLRLCKLARFGNNRSKECALEIMENIKTQLSPLQFFLFFYDQGFQDDFSYEHNLPHIWYKNILERRQEIPNLQVASYLMTSFFPSQSSRQCRIPQEDARLWADILEASTPMSNHTIFRQALKCILGHNLYVPATLEVLSESALKKSLKVRLAMKLIEACAKRLVRKIFSIGYLQKLDNFVNESPEMKDSVDQLLFECNRCVELQCPELDVPWMWPAPPPSMTSGSSHFECYAGKEFGFISQHDFKANPCLPVRRLAIILLGEEDYCSNEKHLLGPVATKLRQLEILGYTVVKRSRQPSLLGPNSIKSCREDEAHENENTYLSLSTPESGSFPIITAIIDILYMCPEMRSGSGTPLSTQPVRLIP